MVRVGVEEGHLSVHLCCCIKLSIAKLIDITAVNINDGKIVVTGQ